MNEINKYPQKRKQSNKPLYIYIVVFFLLIIVLLTFKTKTLSPGLTKYHEDNKMLQHRKTFFDNVKKKSNIK
jgi:hypothetical protein